MAARIRLAETDEERRGAYRLRYEIYVEEMGRYRTLADHDNRWLIEPEDATARIFIAESAGQVIGTSRMNWGGDAPFTERHIAQYRLQDFLEKVPANQIAVGERFMVKPELRGTDLLWSFMEALFGMLNEERIQLSFGDCEPHLLGLYQKMGFRTYSSDNVNSAEAGFLVPLVFVVEDHQHLRDIDSPLKEVLKHFADDARVPADLDRLIRSGTVVLEELTDEPTYWSRIHATLKKVDPGQFSLFEDLDEAETRECLEKSSIISTQPGDRILKAGNTARNMFVILEGVVEMRRRRAPPIYLTVGDLFGEMAFLTGQPREMDIVAFTPGKILCLSESALRALIEDQPRTGARLLLNLARMLCAKVLRTSQA